LFLSDWLIEINQQLLFIWDGLGTAKQKGARSANELIFLVIYLTFI
jgi:hypothetical protein